MVLVLIHTPDKPFPVLPHHLAAYDEPPRVSVVEGEVVVIGDGVCAAYTPKAARAKAALLVEAADRAEQQGAGDPILEFPLAAEP